MTEKTNAAAYTKRESVRLLCKSILNRLENDGSIAFPPRLRQVIQDEMFDLVGPYIWTDEDLREKTVQKMGARPEMLQNSEFSDSEQFRAARAVVKSSFGDDELNGFYFQKPVKTVAESLVGYMMRSSKIEEVFEEDANLEKHIVDVIKRFDLKQLH